MPAVKNTKNWWITLFIMVLIALSFLFSRHRPAARQVKVVDYNLHIRPIFSDKCFKCHGPDENKREAGLRLDTEAGAYAELKDQPGRYAIVPGDPQRSDLWQRINHQDPDLVMPPPSEHLDLSEAEKKYIEQ